MSLVAHSLGAICPECEDGRRTGNLRCAYRPELQPPGGTSLADANSEDTLAYQRAWEHHAQTTYAAFLAGMRNELHRFKTVTCDGHLHSIDAIGFDIESIIRDALE